jgi:alanyl-tRNA synthetase
MTSNDIRQKFLNFFKSKGHAILPSASLIPVGDASVLFTTAGMQPLVPYLLVKLIQRASVWRVFKSAFVQETSMILVTIAI